ncbi:response regulator [Flavobacterium quisquiliarum]|uniref:Response regulator n=1 Tax=Flavobacterium quisquiliarum TaxID=1834436 RepID=A0ABV8W3W3_9FLAO|nr:response regulator [Flavobacterium quisquiliarum]MBW1654591.1 response regulator [Flavobacterium quisquiliarum]NWL01723.1 response regulator [Flavobacterium collinsii]
MKYRNILLVDDDTDDAEIFVTALHAINNKIKYSVENNALEALKKLQDLKLSPDVIFLDYHMPYLDGTEFLKLLRGVKELKNIPVVLYSGHSGTLLKEAIDKFKKVQFLKKQGNFRKLTELLNDIITIETETKK